MDRVEIKGRLEALRERKQMCMKRMDWRGAQKIQEKINELVSSLKKSKVTDGGNMYEASVDWL